MSKGGGACGSTVCLGARAVLKVQAHQMHKSDTCRTYLTAYFIFFYLFLLFFFLPTLNDRLKHTW